MKKFLLGCFAAVMLGGVLLAQDYFYKGVEYYKNKNYPEAVKWFRKAAKQGDAI